MPHDENGNYVPYSDVMDVELVDLRTGESWNSMEWQLEQMERTGSLTGLFSGISQYLLDTAYSHGQNLYEKEHGIDSSIEDPRYLEGESIQWDSDNPYWQPDRPGILPRGDPKATDTPRQQDYDPAETKPLEWWRQIIKDNYDEIGLINEKAMEFKEDPEAFERWYQEKFSDLTPKDRDNLIKGVGQVEEKEQVLLNLLSLING